MILVFVSKKVTVQYTDIQKESRPVIVQAKKGAYRFQHVSAYSGFFKRTLDIVLVLLALPIVLPTLLFLAFLVARDGNNPFYGQTRIGRDGKEFTMWKLRSMVPNAHVLLADHLTRNPAAKREWDETQKLKNDPRVTRIGQLMRKTSLDELPQLWNILVGEMSIVGPRPMMPEQKILYPGKAYYSMRPGLTGLWQVSQRNDSSFASRADFDTSYAGQLSLRTDLGIIFATVGVVVRGTGY